MPVVEELRRGKKEPLQAAAESQHEDGIEKPKTKRVMSDAQKANLAKGRAARAAKLTAAKGEPAPVVEQEDESAPIPTPKKKVPPKIVYESESEHSEPEVVIVKKKKKVIVPKKRIVYEESEEEDEPAPPRSKAKAKPKAAPRSKPERAVSPPSPPVRHVQIRETASFLRFV